MIMPIVPVATPASGLNHGREGIANVIPVAKHFCIGGINFSEAMVFAEYKWMPNRYDLNRLIVAECLPFDGSCG